MSATAFVGLEPEVVAPWILGLGLGAQAPLRFARVGDGKSNLTYLVSDAAGARWILRRAPVGPRLATAHDVAREARVLRALEATPVPAPAVLGFTQDPAVSDVPLLLMTFVDGVLPDERVDPHALVSALARVHAVVPYGDCVEVTGSHVGLIFNRKVYSAVAGALAEPELSDARRP